MVKLLLLSLCDHFFVLEMGIAWLLSYFSSNFPSAFLMSSGLLSYNVSPAHALYVQILVYHDG
jgi:hypothetical protein